MKEGFPGKETLYSPDLYNENWDQFVTWQEQHAKLQTLEIPQEIADVFIPHRIFELSNDPSRVKTLMVQNRPKLPEHKESLNFIVYEHLDYSITDAHAYTEWKKQKQRFFGGLSRHTSNLTPEVDYFHKHNHTLIDSNQLTFNDKVYLHYIADVPAKYPHVVHTRNFFDRPELHGNGIGSSFYNRLEEIYKQLGFKYLAGEIFSLNRSFFANRRVHYDTLSHEIRREIPAPHSLAHHDFFVKTLQ